jgi:hypothetical protein
MWIIEIKNSLYKFYHGPYSSKKQAQVEMAKLALKHGGSYKVVFDPEFK